MRLRLRIRVTTATAALGLLCLGSVGVTTGCGGGGGDTVSTTPPVVDPLAPAVTRGRYRDLEYVLTLPRTEFSVTDDITWTLAVTNVGNETVTISAGSSTFDMYYIYKGDEQIQIGSHGISGLVGHEEFTAGQTRIYNQKWQGASNVTPKTPGNFTLTSWIAAGLYNSDFVPGSKGYTGPGPLTPPSIDFIVK